MKLGRHSLTFYRLPYRKEVRWSNAVEREGTYVLLELESADGVRGIAEGTVKDTWQGVSPRSLAAAMEDLVVPRLEKADLAEPVSVSSAFAKLPENRLAKALVDNACWTMRAAAQGQPLWKRWGRSPRVDLSWTVTRDAPAAMAAEAAEVCSRHGIRALKVKGGQGVEVDRLALREIRAAVGADVELFVDANGAYARDEALAYVRMLAGEGVTLAEDPSPLAPDGAFEALQRESPLPVLVDSSCSSLADAQLYLERGAQALSTKPGRVGLTETRAIEALAASRGARTTVGIYAESLLGTLVSLQQPGAIPAEQTFFLTLTEQVAAVDLPIRDGAVTLPDAPDMAALVDRNALKRFAFSP